MKHLGPVQPGERKAFLLAMWSRVLDSVDWGDESNEALFSQAAFSLSCLLRTANGKPHKVQDGVLSVAVDELVSAVPARKRNGESDGQLVSVSYESTKYKRPRSADTERWDYDHCGRVHSAKMVNGELELLVGGQTRSHAARKTVTVTVDEVREALKAWKTTFVRGRGKRYREHLENALSGLDDADEYKNLL